MSNRGIVVTGIVLVTLAIGAWFLLRSEPFTLVILFDRVGGLRQDDPVTWKGFTIGKVEKIEPLVENRIGVTVRISEEYAGRLGEGTTFSLAESSFFGMLGRNAIEVDTPDRPSRALAAGEKILGVIPDRPSLLEQGRKWTLEQWSQIRERSAELAGEFRNSPHRAEAEEALDALGKLASDAARQTGESLEDFRKRHQAELDEILGKLDRLRQELKRESPKSH